MRCLGSGGDPARCGRRCVLTACTAACLQGWPYQAAVLDSEAAALPARGKPVADAAEAAAVAALAEAAAARGGR